MTPNGFRRIALGLNGAIEGAHQGHPDFRVAGRVFATLGFPNLRSGMVKLTLDQQRTCIADHPNSFVPVSGRWGEQGATTVRLDAVEEDSLGEALTLAWRNMVEKASEHASKRKWRSARKVSRKEIRE